MMSLHWKTEFKAQSTVSILLLIEDQQIFITIKLQMKLDPVLVDTSKLTDHFQLSKYTDQMCNPLMMKSRLQNLSLKTMLNMELCNVML